MSLDDIVGSNLADKDRMKIDMARDDATAQHIFLRSDKVVAKVAQIVITTSQINDSFIISHVTNSILDTSILGDRRTSFTTTTLTVNI